MLLLLDKHVVRTEGGQARRAIALRPHAPARSCPPPLRRHHGQTIIMIGPTAWVRPKLRAGWHGSPSRFSQVEASSLHMLGYVAAMSKSMIRDLVENRHLHVRESAWRGRGQGRDECPSSVCGICFCLPSPRLNACQEGSFLCPARTAIAYAREAAPASPRGQTGRPHGRGRHSRAQSAAGRLHLQPDMEDMDMSLKDHASDIFWGAAIIAR